VGSLFLYSIITIPIINTSSLFLALAFGAIATLFFVLSIAIVLLPILLILRLLIRVFLIRLLPPRSNRDSKHTYEDLLKGKTQAKLNFLLGVAVFTLAEIVFIVDTELMIKRSSNLVKQGEAQWTFGQTLAMFMTVLPLIEAARGLWKSYNEREEKISPKDPKNAVGSVNPIDSMNTTTLILSLTHSRHNKQVIPGNESTVHPTGQSTGVDLLNSSVTKPTRRLSV
jgi:hypothetical protein